MSDSVGGATGAPSSAQSSAPSAPSTPSSSVSSGAAAALERSPGGQMPAGNGGGDPGAKAVGGGSPETTSTKQETQEAAKQEAARRLKLKVRGREMELDEGEVIRRAELAEGAEQKFQEAAQLRKQAEQFFQTLLSDPMSVLTHPELADKIKFRELAENYLSQELQKEMLSPEQRELQELRDYRQKQQKATEDAQKEQLTRTQQQEMAKLQQRAAQEYDVKISEVLQQSDLPKNAHTVKRVAEMLYNALQKGYDLDVQTAVDMVREGYMTEISSLVGGLEGPSLIKALGPDIVKKLRKHDLAQLKAKTQPTESAPQTNPNPQPAQKESQYMRPDEWKEFLRKKAGV